MTLDKLKVAARQHEQKEEWRAAIDLYREAIRSGEADLGGADPALYNRIGDLEQKAGDTEAATEAWEQAAFRYGEQGFFNNAIALCGKILRLDPDKVRIYLELARFHSRKRVIYDVRQNLTIYHEQMGSRGEVQAASEAILELERQFSSWTDLRLLLDELLERESEPEVAAPELGAPSVENDLVFLDTDSDTELNLERASEPDGEGVGSEDLVVEPTSLEISPITDPGNDVMAELVTTSLGGHDSPGEVEEVSGIVEFEHTVGAVGSPEVIEGLEATELTSSETINSEDVITLDGLEPPTLSIELDEDDGVDAGEAIAIEQATVQGADNDDGLIFLDTDTESEPEVSPVAEPESDSPTSTPEITIAGTSEDDPLGSRVEGHEKLEDGDRAGAIAKLEEALEGYQQEEEWAKSWQVATELIEADPRGIDRHQLRVEMAVRLRDQEKLAKSYFELGEALVSEGSEEKAIAVFRRLLEIDELHEGGRAALRKMAPEVVSEETEDGFVDFGAMVIDDVGPRSTRMRTETTAISDDEDETFREALAEFKRALDQNVEVEDYQTHYDLGVAFKEMGLYEEAISAFQKALRSPEGRLRTSEALGQCFYDQGRPAVAEAVLRAVEKASEDDSEKIGVLYWLGRSLEEQGKTKSAVNYYERVMAVDVSFSDASDRATDLAK